MGCGATQPVKVAPRIDIQNKSVVSQAPSELETKENKLNELESGYVSIHGDK